MLTIIKNNFTHAPAYITCAAGWVQLQLTAVDEAQHLKWVATRLKREQLLALHNNDILAHYLGSKHQYNITFAELVLGIDIVLEYLYHIYTENTGNNN